MAQSVKRLLCQEYCVKVCYFCLFFFCLFKVYLFHSVKL